MTRSEIWRLEKYLRDLMGLTQLRCWSGHRLNSVEVHIGGEFIGLIYKDDEEGDVAYNFNMSILEMDLPEPPPSRR